MKLIDVLDCLDNTEDMAIEFEDDDRWNWFWYGKVKHTFITLKPYYGCEIVRLRTVPGGYEEDGTLIITLKGGLK